MSDHWTHNLPDFPAFLNRDVRPIANDLISAVSYFDYKMADLIRTDPTAVDRIVVTAETECLRVRLDNMEFTLKMMKRLFGIGYRNWKDGVEGVSSEFTSLSRDHSEPAYDVLFAKAME